MTNLPFSNHESRGEHTEASLARPAVNKNTTPTFLAVEACFRILDSPAGKAALSIAFTGLNAVNTLQKISSKSPKTEGTTVTSPLDHETKANPSVLAAYIQRARALYNQAPSHPVSDQSQLRGKTMAAGLLRDTQQIAALNKDDLSFREALDTVVAQRDVTKYGAEWSRALEVAETIAEGHFTQVGSDIMTQRSSAER